MERILLAGLLLLSLTQSVMAQTMEDYFSVKYDYPQVNLKIAKDYTFIVPQQTTYQKGNCLSYQAKNDSGSFTLLLDKSAIIDFAKTHDKEKYQLLQENVDVTSVDKLGCQIFKPTTEDNQRMIELLFQEAISTGKATIRNEKGEIVPHATVIYSAYYETGSIIYKIDDAILWVESWYIS